jgi:hypothetical protein
VLEDKQDEDEPAFIVLDGPEVPPEYPRFTCPICGGVATLVDGPGLNPECLCLDCPIDVELTAATPAASKS